MSVFTRKSIFNHIIIVIITVQTIFKHGTNLNYVAYTFDVFKEKIIDENNY